MTHDIPLFIMNTRNHLRHGALSLLSIPMLLTMILLSTGCDSRIGDTVESSHLEYEWQEPTYSFKRNATSSVVLTECTLLRQPIDYLYQSRLRLGRVANQTDLDMTLRYFDNGFNGEKPADAVSTSPLHVARHDEVRAQLRELIHEVAYVVGLSRSGGFDAMGHNTQASKGVKGFVGRNVGDQDRFYVDSLGFAPSEIFYYYIVGAVYLDRIFNTHLDYSIYASPEIRSQHQAGVLVPGNNYTTMEHRWDLAYGYYQLARPLIFDTNGIDALKGVDRKVRYAFAYGRKAMNSDLLWYDEVDRQAHTIRREFAQAIGLKVMSLLMDVNVHKNLSDERSLPMAFEGISRACGLMMSLQFVRTEDDRPLFTEAEVTHLIEMLREGDGLWDSTRLLASPDTKGSLAYLATEIAKKFNLTLDMVIK